MNGRGLDAPASVSTPFDFSRRNRARTAGSILIVFLLVALSAFVVISFFGVIRIGEARVFETVLCEKFDKNGKPIEKTTFDGDEERLYCFASVSAFEDTEIEARWLKGNTLAARFKGDFGKIAGRFCGRFISSRGHVKFALESPRTGFLPGSYRVEIFLDGKQVSRLSFSVRESRERVRLESKYTDDMRHFSIGYPANWQSADSSSLGGALAGFISMENGTYPPRVAVVLTKFESVSLDYLNGILSASGTKGEEFFSGYSLGDRAGARRKFNWQYEGHEGLSLTSIQVLIQGNGCVYGIDCHSLSGEFEKNLPVFNAIINSFRLKD
ncbi:MAG: hypothetical protein PHP64_02605 [Actinomycetota bacterium]|nr:hypothetical protein [Actinomycetota bacterium]